jgi:hypothetical protein
MFYSIMKEGGYEAVTLGKGKMKRKPRLPSFLPSEYAGDLN